MEAGKRGRTWLTLSLSSVVEGAKLPYPSVRRVLRRVEDEGLAELRASGALQRYRVLRKPDRERDLPALLASVADGLAGERQRLAAVRGYVLELTCRQAHALAYLGEADLTPCGVCDLCQGAAPVDERALATWDWRARFDPEVVREMAALGRCGEGDAVGVARALCQVSTPRSRPYRKHRAWGLLERAPYRDVLAAVTEALG